MFDISFGEFLLIVAVAMAFLGPERIPEAARAIGRGVRRIRDAFSQVRDEMAADEQTARAMSEMQETMQEIARAVNVRHVVRELSEPLLTSPLVREPGETRKEEEAFPAKPEGSEKSKPSALDISGPQEEALSASGDYLPSVDAAPDLPGPQGETPRRIEKKFHPALEKHENGENVPPLSG